ncbi:MAG: carbohydrate ABC transporter permease, partial [Clostridiaceae bacterium]|nr:carbohydrate ABC transporter permease [Clostridiaceae bacterium]
MMSRIFKGQGKLNQITNTGNILLNILFILTTIVCLAPVLLVLAISFTCEEAIRNSGYSFIPQEVTLKAYDYVL